MIGNILANDSKPDETTAFLDLLPLHAPDGGYNGIVALEMDPCDDNFSKGRNGFIFENQESTLETILERAHQLIAKAEAMKQNPNRVLIVNHPPRSQSPNFWIAPSSAGTFKVNIDTTLINGRREGVGVVIRN
ncbi:hypothetical protein PIB30_071524 [Stylosanthes scabra]|uniref:Uncharacterized protein n=1 Tax=Stylosanthes scabra TaxID=79078 RepID=A0ABU6ZMJ9_9FABA|nr:hypothetical protein [Stylosanthes scabra]